MAARAAIQHCNNINGRAIARTMAVGGWRDQPDIPPSLLLAISNLHDNVPQLMSLSRKTIGAGSGIPHSTNPFQVTFGDIMGKWTPDTSGATYKMFCTESTVLYSEIYAIDDKTAGADAIIRWDKFAHTCGYWVEYLYFDYASEVSTEYIDRLNAMFHPSIPTYNPHHKPWSQLAAADPARQHTINRERTTRYLRLLGSTSYQMITGQNSPMVNLLAKDSNAPTDLSEAALIHVAQHELKLNPLCAVITCNEYPRRSNQNARS